MNLLIHAATIDKVKVGDWVFTVCVGWERVRLLNERDAYPIETAGNSFTESGLLHFQHKYPSIFLIDPFNGTKPPEPEPDWEKVTKGTKVQCSPEPHFPWYADERKFLAYAPECVWPFVVSFQHPNGPNSVEIHKHCRLAPGVEIKPEWLKAPL